jgi:hypothetical protein
MNQIRAKRFDIDQERATAFDYLPPPGAGVSLESMI